MSETEVWLFLDAFFKFVSAKENIWLLLGTMVIVGLVCLLFHFLKKWSLVKS